MFAPSAISTRPYLNSLMITPHASNDQTKVDPDQLYFRPQRTVEIIQLIEVSPPTPRCLSPIDSSSIASSSSSEYSSESEYDYPSDNEDETICSSYCSSDALAQMDSLRCDDEEASKPDETYDIRIIRVHAWRDTFAKAMNPLPYDLTCTKSAKRKSFDGAEVDDIAALHSSKRSRSDHEKSSLSIISAHICAACDASFSDPQDLRWHGQATQSNEACRIAVEYDFE